VSITQRLGRVGKFHVATRSDLLSSHAGLVLVQEFAQQLQVAKTLDEQLQVKSRERGYSEAQAVLALVYNVVSGGTCLSDLEVLGFTRRPRHAAIVGRGIVAGAHHGRRVSAQVRHG